MDAMHERGMDPILCKDEFEAMALLVRRERDRRAGEGRVLTVVLVLGSGDSGRAGALFRSAAVHAPHAAFWQYEGESKQLRAFAPPAPERAPAFGELVVRRGAVRRATLRLAGDGAPDGERGADAPPAPTAQAARAPTGSIPDHGTNRTEPGAVEGTGRAHGPSPAALTDEELDMLLADDR